MKIASTLLTFALIVIFASCENEDMSQESIKGTHWSNRTKDYYKTKEAKKAYGDEETIEEAREFFDSPIGWARDLGKPPSAFGEQGEQCGGRDVDYQVTESDRIALGDTLSDEEKESILTSQGPLPAFSREVNTPLDKIAFGSQEMKDAGYYQYYPSSNARTQDRRFGTERTVWRVKAAAQILKEKGIVMAVGDISQRGGAGTGGHKSHKRGVDVDLRLVAPDGMGASCAHYNQGCNDSDKTSEMIKAMIAVDPNNVRTVLINDPEVQRQVNEYSRSIGLGDIAKSCAGHNNHVHVSYKN